MYVGDVTCLATMTPEIQAEAQFLAKANGVIAGIALANMVFAEVDPSLKVSCFDTLFTKYWFYDTKCVFCNILYSYRKL